MRTTGGLAAVQCYHMQMLALRCFRRVKVEEQVAVTAAKQSRLAQQTLKVAAAAEVAHHTFAQSAAVCY